jgi:hypothetical protein
MNLDLAEYTTLITTLSALPVGTKLWNLFWEGKRIQWLAMMVVGFSGYKNKSSRYSDDRKIRSKAEELCQITRDNLNNHIKTSNEIEKDQLRFSIKKIDRILDDLKNKPRGDPYNFSRKQRKGLIKLDESLIRELDDLTKISARMNENSLEELNSGLQNAGEALTKRTSLVISI